MIVNHVSHVYQVNKLDYHLKTKDQEQHHFLWSFTLTSMAPWNAHNWDGQNTTFIDYLVRKVFVYFLKDKGNITLFFHSFKCEVENELNHKIKIICTDNETEYCNTVF